MLQMTELKKCNSQLFKELSETKSNVENIKAKLAQCKHSTPTDYQPGMLAGKYNFSNYIYTYIEFIYIKYI